MAAILPVSEGDQRTAENETARPAIIYIYRYTVRLAINGTVGPVRRKDARQMQA